MGNLIDARHLLATAALGPLLLVQGLHVRRVTPRLPEPPGPRSGHSGGGHSGGGHSGGGHSGGGHSGGGHSGGGAPLRLLVAGDSAAAGVGAGSQAEALAGRLVAELSVRRALEWRLEARTGYTTADAHAHLEALRAERFDVVVLSLGVNDVTRGVGRTRWLARQAALADLLAARFAPRVLVFTALPPMHLFPALPQPLRWYLGARARDFNAALADWLPRRPGHHLVVPDFPPGSAASDGFHPGPAAYAAWATRVACEIDLAFPVDEDPGLRSSGAGSARHDLFDGSTGGAPDADEGRRSRSGPVSVAEQVEGRLPH